MPGKIYEAASSLSEPLAEQPYTIDNSRGYMISAVRYGTHEAIIRNGQKCRYGEVQAQNKFFSPQYIRIREQGTIYEQTQEGLGEDVQSCEDSREENQAAA